MPKKKKDPEIERAFEELAQFLYKLYRKKKSEERTS
jgi:hypothetical protein